DEATGLAESAVYKKSKAALQRKLDRLHPADIAYILEALPFDERLYIWDLVRAARDGEILLEVSDAVRESLISSMDTEELVAAAGMSCRARRTSSSSSTETTSSSACFR